MTTDEHEVDAFLMSAGGKAAKFDEPGDLVSGVVVHSQMFQQRDFKTKVLKFWDDGNPMMELQVLLATKDADDAEDEGLRRLYVRGRMQTAIAAAIRKVGAGGLRPGGKLVVKYLKDGEAAKGMSAPKLYQARYEAPDEAVEVETEAAPF
jgi:hypothetical protein